MFRPLLNQPTVNGRAELILEYPPESMHPITAKLRQFLRIIGFAVVCQHKVSERHLLVRHRMEERLQLFRLVITGEAPYQFLVFQFPQVVVVHFVREIGDDTAYKDLQGFRDGQLAAIDFRPDVPVRIQVGKYALFMLADRVVELMHQQRDVAKGDAAALTPTGNEYHFTGAQDFIMEQRAADPCVPTAAKYQIVDIRVVITNRFTCRVAFHFKVAVNRILIAKRGVMSVRVLHDSMLLNYRLVWAMVMLSQIVTISPSISHIIGLDVPRDTRPAKW